MLTVLSVSLCDTSFDQ